jgi:hypothetical protein
MRTIAHAVVVLAASVSLASAVTVTVPADWSHTHGTAVSALTYALAAADRYDLGLCNSHYVGADAAGVYCLDPLNKGKLLLTQEDLAASDSQFMLVTYKDENAKWLTYLVYRPAAGPSDDLATIGNRGGVLYKDDITTAVLKARVVQRARREQKALQEALKRCAPNCVK